MALDLTQTVPPAPHLAWWAVAWDFTSFSDAQLGAEILHAQQWASIASAQGNPTLAAGWSDYGAAAQKFLTNRAVSNVPVFVDTAGNPTNPVSASISALGTSASTVGTAVSSAFGGAGSIFIFAAAAFLIYKLRK